MLGTPSTFPLAQITAGSPLPRRFEASICKSGRPSGKIGGDGGGGFCSRIAGSPLVADFFPSTTIRNVLLLI